MTTRLSPNFTLEELCVTQHRDIDNRPPAQVIKTLRETARRMEGVRAELDDRVITVTSGYRSPELNRRVGGARTSAHLKGYAVDFNCHGFGDPARVCRALAAADLPFDQIIEEGSWCHISFDPRLRRQVLTRTRSGDYALGLLRAASRPVLASAGAMALTGCASLGGTDAAATAKLLENLRGCERSYVGTLGGLAPPTASISIRCAPDQETPR
ncbi:D-Ala-D-Ala carboxypeptidase family metallohydrolase [Phenylobacterium sp.]|jgi:putative chitinase|uniref:D-Ala-D-Ala carboxypeptidase family metallohydrolase n=1 Tax=Phenylobacterium sp. TaxID=1871053 RepID=UPI0037CCB5DD